jgi:hypothetical protein
MANATAILRGSTAIFRCNRRSRTHHETENFSDDATLCPSSSDGGSGRDICADMVGGSDPEQTGMASRILCLDFRASHAARNAPNRRMVGCAGMSEEIAQCWFTDYNGTINFQGQFARLDGHPVGPLKIQPGDMSDFRSVARKHGEVIRIVRLEQGGVMAPLPFLSNLDSSGNPKD